MTLGVTMPIRWVYLLRKALRQTLPGAIAIALISAACWPVHPDFTIVGCLYLLVVVLQSAYASFAACGIVSLLAVASLDYFFVAPLLSLQIARPANGLALLTFLATALVTTRLASRAREETRKADARRRDLARLYELASRLVSVRPETAASGEYLGIYRAIFGVRALCLFDGQVAAGTCEGESEHELASQTEEAYIYDRDLDNPQKGIAIRCLRVLGKPIGAIGFEGLTDAESMSGPLSMLAAAMIQRSHYFETASKAAAATQVEVLRTAVLDAFAHQFKTPLAGIIAAAGSLREIGPLLPQQAEMVESIEDQAAGLGRLTTRLLRMTRLDQDEIKPRMRTTELADLVERVTHQFRNLSHGHRLLLNARARPVQILCDPEMLSLSLAQLVDNALRYAQASSEVVITIDTEGGLGVVLVTNKGNAIPIRERTRIFDRYYRCAENSHSPGTGLGLYVARKIVLAHGGILELDYEHVYGSDTTFYLKLPLAIEQTESEYGAEYELAGSSPRRRR